jgi:anaphase-promoting complex subunit 4
METNAFSQISALYLPSVSRLLLPACSPDKDLVALISRLGGKDRLSLWKMQRSKKWEVDVGTDQNRSEEIVALAWSPSGMTLPCPCGAEEVNRFAGQSIALAHNPPRITLHSVQDGREERSLPIQSAAPSPRRSHRLTNIWWFQVEKIEKARSIPDIFRRGGVIVCTLKLSTLLLPSIPICLCEDRQRSFSFENASFA